MPSSTSHNAKPERLLHVTRKPAFETIVSAHGTTVLRVCRAVVSAADADDAWSDTFLAAMRAYPELPEDANVEAWLVTIAHRKAIDITRRNARRTAPVATQPDTARAVTDDRFDAEVEVIHALHDLPPKQRQAVSYHYLGGLPYAEVAAIIGGNAAAARRAAADGISQLRRTYASANTRKGVPDEE